MRSGRAVEVMAFESAWNDERTVFFQRRALCQFDGFLHMVLRQPLSPLLEEKRHARSAALIPQTAEPVRVRRHSLPARFPAGDQPMDAIDELRAITLAFAGHVAGE